MKILESEVEDLIRVKNKEGTAQMVDTIWKLGKRGEIMLITPFLGYRY